MDYLAEVIKQYVRLRRLENGVAEALSKKLDSAFGSLLKGLEGKDNPQTRRAVVQRFLDGSSEDFKRVFKEVNRSVKSHAVSIGLYQSDQTAKILARASGKGVTDPASAKALRQRFDETKIHGRTFAEWDERNQKRLARRLQQQTALGLQNGETLEEVHARAKRYGFDEARRNAEALARTATTHLANRSIFEVGKANPEVTQGYRLKVTFDSRTSKICLAYGARNEVYSYEDVSPVPPFHFRCRTILLPVLLGREALDIPEDGTAWFGALSEDTQNEILGARRAQLFRDGRLRLQDLIGDDNTVLTLEELGVALKEKSVSEIFDFDVTKAFNVEFVQSLAAIDEVLSEVDWQVVPKIKVVIGEADFQQGVYDEVNKIVRISRKADEPGLAFTHEVGHIVSYELLGKGRYSVKYSALLDEWREASESSDAIRVLKKFEGAKIGAYLDARGKQRRDLIDKKLVDYLLDDEEQFARAFAQFVAIKSGNSTLSRQLNHRRQNTGYELYYPTQWKDEDFKKIATALEKLFKSKGWLK